jgi:Leucine-rich repeat (LRR) protein
MRLRSPQELPPSIFELREAVKTLDVSNNRLASLPPSLAALTNLQRLVRAALLSAVAPGWPAPVWLTCSGPQVLTQNALTALPPALCALTGLKLLVLDGNALTSLPSQLGALSKLEKLSVAGNALSALPDALGALKSLKSLCVARNALRALPAALAGCTALEELDASGNALQELPGALGSLPRLALLQLDDNALRGVPSELLRGCGALTTLSLHGNPVTIDALEAIDGWAEFDARQRAKQSKRVAGGVLIGARGLDDGLDHATTKIVVPHT